ncbi:hypothetical protein ZEAMMB73_Zm00001d012297 [Zea mays]|uniref:Uncharacterized protein n=1 Tax=Zea mays TaxID=4577 RepID=A0A1D6G830_MAIZE|nr:hypothetical protein ZEAMMB73_Zm00001d012297 [Zea mays]
MFSSPPPRVPLSPQPLSAASSSVVLGVPLHARPRPTTLAAPPPSSSMTPPLAPSSSASEPALSVMGEGKAKEEQEPSS